MAEPNTSAQQKKSKAQQKNGAAKFFREVKSEMKKVIWPTKKELISYTAIVFVTVLFVTALIGITDGIFSELFRVFSKFAG
jgi:preprotein translocase subunit SecE